MSSRSVNAAEQIVNNLLKAKGHSRTLLTEMRGAEREANRVLSLTSQLARGDVLSIITQLSALGPYGVAAAVAIGVGATAYGVYQQLTKERPTEVYYWRYAP